MIVGGKSFTALPKKKRPVVRGSFSRLISETNLEAQSYSPDGEYNGNLHKK